jgi:hypothetical protein
MARIFLILSALVSTNALASQLELGRAALKSMTGCYLVDYSYTETESLKPGYVRDSRVYDVNRDKSVKEWIFAEELSQTRVRLQHILFATDLDGTLMGGSELKHQVEDWEFDAPFLYDFTGPSSWQVKDLGDSHGLWTRRITNLDDGLRYQCAAAWSLETAYPEWSCSNYAPIPGRETRDMGRRDYNTLARGTRLVAYQQSWLERQDNVKTIHDPATGARTPLARELGKNWYVRLPDAECAPAKAFSAPRLAFWQVLREAWDEVLVGDRPFIERAVAGQQPRFAMMMEIEEQFRVQALDEPAVRRAAKDAILKLIADYRAN